MRSSFAFNFNLRRYIKASVSYRSEHVEYDGTITFMPDVFTASSVKKTKDAAAAGKKEKDAPGKKEKEKEKEKGKKVKGKDAPGKKEKDALLCSSVTVQMTFKAPGVAALKGASFALHGQYHCQKREDDSYLTLTGGVEGERSIDLGRAAQVDPRFVRPWFQSARNYNMMNRLQTLLSISTCAATSRLLRLQQHQA